MSTGGAFADPANELSEDSEPFELDGRPTAPTADPAGPSIAPNLESAALIKAEHQKQQIRVTTWLLVMVAVSGLCTFLAAVFAPASAWERVDRAATLILVPLLTLLGTAVGWYFSEKRRD
ncbi:hypothetical protein [Cellulomonas alba]|uniref:Uncharacterized protein n=1 Tax=Cellulomonas alba TaxID=3053467 RepID=A0ABT7SH17_9CELL|nr:hypothetical protein [Cellulomonas alba]MDM7855490.1 hypothetical protein [Cellulomonas alba]